MVTTNLTAVLDATQARVRSLGRGSVLAIYVAFAAIVFLVHGFEPPLSIDHVTYFKLADEIRNGFPGGDYYRSWNSVRSYGVILAYLFPLTGSHIVSLKLLLAVMTVGYLLAFHLFMTLTKATRPQAVLFSLMSALFVSFGASIWGMTDFAASLNRTIVVPFVVLLVWFFFRAFATPWRYLVYPALIVISTLHLSALHVFLVFLAFEALDFAFRRRLRVDRDIPIFVLSVFAALAIQFGIERLGIGNTDFVRWNLAKALALDLPAPAAGPVIPAPKAPTGTPAGPGAATSVAPGTDVPPPPEGTTRRTESLTPKEAWDIELLAFPWRNLPPTLATIATMGLSFGVILLLAVTGAVRLHRRRELTALDRSMIVFAGAVLAAAYGLQLTLLVARNFFPIYPTNFEEIRAVNMLMFPAVHFVFRLYQSGPTWRGYGAQAVRAAIVAAFVLQPIVVIRSLPASWREAIIETAIARGAIARTDSLRIHYARQFLGLAGDPPRFYYGARKAMEWLERTAAPGDKVMTSQNEFYASQVETVGVFLNIVSMDVRTPERHTWAARVEAVDRVIRTRDLSRIIPVARSVDARFVVVPWQVEGAAYSDEHYSILKLR